MGATRLTWLVSYKVFKKKKEKKTNEKENCGNITVVTHRSCSSSSSVLSPFTYYYCHYNTHNERCTQRDDSRCRRHRGIFVRMYRYICMYIGRRQQPADPNHCHRPARVCMCVYTRCAYGTQCVYNIYTYNDNMCCPVFGLCETLRFIYWYIKYIYIHILCSFVPWLLPYTLNPLMDLQW